MTSTLPDIQVWCGLCQDWDHHKRVQETYPALPINPVWAKTTQKKNSDSNANKRKNIYKDGVGSTWKEVMAEASLGTVGKWDDKHEWRLERLKEINFQASGLQKKKKSGKKIIEEYTVEDIKSGRKQKEKSASIRTPVPVVALDGNHGFHWSLTAASNSKQVGCASGPGAGLGSG